MLQKLSSILNRYLTPQDKIILAISGGPDSVCLLDLLLKLNFKPILAHLNHKLRGSESDLDEKFVKYVAEKHHLKLESKSLNWKTKNPQSLPNLEAKLRQVRYRFLEKIRQKHHAKFILTAHHLNDNLETALLNFTRGCNLSGLNGMSTLNNKILRPLLSFTKNEILNYCQKNKLKYRNDSSNNDPRFSRNLIRLQIIPLLKKINPHLEKTFSENQRNWREINDFLLRESQFWLSTHLLKTSSLRATARVSPTNKHPRLFTKTNKTFSNSNFITLHPALQKNILKEIYRQTHQSSHNLTSQKIQEIINLIKNNKTNTEKKFGGELTAKTAYGKTTFLLKNRQQSKKIIKKIQLSIPGRTEYEFGAITTKISSNAGANPAMCGAPLRKTNNPTSLLTLNFDLLENQPIYLRSWQTGDKINPLGMIGRKKLQDIFVNKKIPREERIKIPILTTEKEIIALGKLNLINEKFKITPQTKRILVIW